MKLFLMMGWLKRQSTGSYKALIRKSLKKFFLADFVEKKCAIISALVYVCPSVHQREVLQYGGDEETVATVLGSSVRGGSTGRKK